MCPIAPLPAVQIIRAVEKNERSSLLRVRGPVGSINQSLMQEQEQQLEEELWSWVRTSEVELGRLSHRRRRVGSRISDADVGPRRRLGTIALDDRQHRRIPPEWHVALSNHPASVQWQGRGAGGSSAARRRRR
jgi:hypothetical protein